MDKKIRPVSYSSQDNNRTEDSKKYNKDCCDFVCLKDGTVTGEYRYCEYSLNCRQIGVKPTGEFVSMEAHYLKILDPVTNKVVAHELFCTGNFDLRSKNERIEDDIVS